MVEIVPRPQTEKILVVDDQASMRALACAMLRSIGFVNLRTAADGAEALLALKEESFALVLLDGDMPRLNGLETLRVIRADAALKHVPVLMVTGRADRAFVADLVRAGVNGYVLKPTSAADLRRHITPLLAKAV